MHSLPSPVRRSHVSMCRRRRKEFLQYSHQSYHTPGWYTTTAHARATQRPRHRHGQPLCGDGVISHLRATAGATRADSRSLATDTQGCPHASSAIAICPSIRISPHAAVRSARIRSATHTLRHALRHDGGFAKHGQARSINAPTPSRNAPTPSRCVRCAHHQTSSRVPAARRATGVGVARTRSRCPGGGGGRAQPAVAGRRALSALTAHSQPSQRRRHTHAAASSQAPQVAQFAPRATHHAWTFRTAHKARSGGATTHSPP